MAMGYEGLYLAVNASNVRLTSVDAVEPSNHTNGLDRRVLSLGRRPRPVNRYLAVAAHRSYTLPIDGCIVMSVRLVMFRILVCVCFNSRLFC